MTEAHAPSASKGKLWVPLENNPQTFLSLSSSLGISPKLTYHDIYTLDRSFFSFVPRPVLALLFTVQASVYHRARDAEFAAQEPYTGSGANERVVWYKQTIGNACGLIAWLHAMSNGECRYFVEDEGLMSKILRETRDLGPEERAQWLYDSGELESVHAVAAGVAETEVPSGEKMHTDNHYIAFVKGDGGRVWELNGGMKGPVERGVLEGEEDMLSEKALEMSVESFLKFAGQGEVEFSLVAVVAE